MITHGDATVNVNIKYGHLKKSKLNYTDPSEVHVYEHALVIWTHVEFQAFTMRR